MGDSQCWYLTRSHNLVQQCRNSGPNKKKKKKLKTENLITEKKLLKSSRRKKKWNSNKIFSTLTREVCIFVMNSWKNFFVLRVKDHNSLATEKVNHICSRKTSHLNYKYAMTKFEIQTERKNHILGLWYWMFLCIGDYGRDLFVLAFFVCFVWRAVWVGAIAVSLNF